MVFGLPKFKVVLGVLLVFGLFQKTWAALPNPPDQVLIVWTDDSCDGGSVANGTLNFAVSMVTNLESALSALGALAPTVNTIETSCSTTGQVGIETALNNAGYSLNNYCEVFDLRFIAWPGYADCTAGGNSSMITNTGANNDTSLYLNYLSQGGHLIIVGDNSGFCNRDSSIVSFVGAATGCNLGWSVNDVQTSTFTIASTFNPPLQGAYNTLSLYAYNEPGFLPPAGICGATILTENGGNVYDMLWPSNKLTTGAGSLELVMDTDALKDGTQMDLNNGTPPPDLVNTGYAAYWQNVYAMNGGCYKMNVTETVAPPTVCVGQSVTFTICLQNIGTQPLVNPQILDPLPSCLTYQSSTPSGGAMSGTTFIYNYSGSLAASTSICVQVAAQANSTNCP